ncbi:MAG TPA: SRPBCC domain-containing protein [Acidobacteriaceae bacterium]|jgi:uncharacterized protein YndB with AHSA1/START domain|nr:SRPBCC domain-containing protein [Acidobacteriaceae bacterium]
MQGNGSSVADVSNEREMVQGGGMDATMLEPLRGYELKITRVFNAPRELVWKAWTEPERTVEWRGPRGFKVTEFENTWVEGERWRLTMVGKVPATGQPATMRQSGRVLEVRPPELLRYTFQWDERSCAGLPESPFKESVITVSFEEQGDKTVMHFTQGPFATESERDGHMGGWNSAFDRFAEFMLAEGPPRQPKADETPTELHMRRTFAAPLQMVFDAWTKPERMREWWGPACFTTPVCELDARSGGSIRIHMQAPDGTVYPIVGKFVEFFPPYRFHYTSSPLDGKGQPLFELWTSVFFEEVEGGTEVVLDVHVTKSTPQAPMYLKGMKEGWKQTLDKLGAFVTAGNVTAKN